MYVLCVSPQSEEQEGQPAATAASQSVPAGMVTEQPGMVNGQPGMMAGQPGMMTGMMGQPSMSQQLTLYNPHQTRPQFMGGQGLYGQQQVRGEVER